MFSFLQLLFTLGMYLIGVIIWGIALCPSVYLVMSVWLNTQNSPLVLRCLFISFSLALGWIIFGLTLLFLVGLTRFILRIKLKEGVYPIFSLEMAKWAFVNSLYLSINFVFMDFVLLTPFANLLFKMLGVKLGKNVEINSKYIFDASLIEIQDNTVIGGNAVIIGHQVERGYIKLKKVIIGKNVTIGSNALISPGCEIGDHSIIGAGTVLLKNTKVPPHTVVMGVPGEYRKRGEHETKI